VPERARPPGRRNSLPAGLRSRLSRSIEAPVFCSGGEHPGNHRSMRIFMRWSATARRWALGRQQTPSPAAEASRSQGADHGDCHTAGLARSDESAAVSSGLTPRCRASSSLHLSKHRAGQPPSSCPRLCSTAVPWIPPVIATAPSRTWLTVQPLRSHRWNMRAASCFLRTSVDQQRHPRCPHQQLRARGQQHPSNSEQQHRSTQQLRTER